MFLLHLIVIFGLILRSNQWQLNNVCKDLESYKTILVNPNCWHDADVGATADKIARNNGYDLESHQVRTEDGYILTVFHIPGQKGRSVLLHHGIPTDSTTFMLMKNESLSFYLASQGYDVWLTNARGTKYSTKHVKYSVYDKHFWDFSFHEMGYYEIPAIIDYIKSHTQSKNKIELIGHSMGTAASLVYASTRPQHAKDNLNSMILLAPAAFLYNMKSGLKVAAQYYKIINSTLSPLSSYGIGSNLGLIVGIVDGICASYPGVIFCWLIVEIFSGSNPVDNCPEMIPVFLSHALSGFSFKTLIHFAQNMNVPESFRQFDYGEAENLRRYNTTEPLQYNLSSISVPVHLYYGRNDFLSDEIDVMFLYDRLQTTKTIQHVLTDGSSNYSHINFLEAKSLLKLYEMIVQNLK